MIFVGYALLFVGGFVCLLNFYLSFVRYPIFWLRGHQDQYKFISGFPLVGSLAVAMSLFWLYDIVWIFAMAIVFILLDTGGIHWFAGVVLYEWLFGKKEDGETDDTSQS